MADLLRINGTPINKTLEGLSKNRVEGLIDIEVQYTIRKRKCHAILEPLHSIPSLLFNEIRGHTHRLTQSLYIRVTVENLHRKRDVQDALTREDIFLDGLHDELYDVVLGGCLHIIAELHPAHFLLDEVVL